jgi:hypothetical protein
MEHSVITFFPVSMKTLYHRFNKTKEYLVVRLLHEAHQVLISFNVARESDGMWREALVLYLPYYGENSQGFLKDTTTNTDQNSGSKLGTSRMLSANLLGASDSKLEVLMTYFLLYQLENICENICNTHPQIGLNACLSTGKINTIKLNRCHYQCPRSRKKIIWPWV